MYVRFFTAMLISVATTAIAHDAAIHSSVKQNVPAALDIVESRIRVDGGELVFTQKTAGPAGLEKPRAIGKLGGSAVYSYVWPTSLDSAAVGFDKEQGILALAATIHPDFDDTPLFDESRDGTKDNDGGVWHSHWVVLVKDEQCGKDGMKVRDIPKDAKPRLPATWPGLPILIDSPGYGPRFESKTVTIRVPLKDVGMPADFQFDGVTSSLQVNANVHAPLLCINRVFDVASGDLSLPGKLSR
ncbi:MAG TPA: hypothetical protein VJS66_03665 [Burkholderiales bacterium]|nr:hypothetical protein [Burkholderiales bacterium]